MATPRTILLGYADDAAGDAALRAAALEARVRGSSLTVMHKLIGNEVPDRYGRSARAADNRRVAASDLLREAQDAAPGIEHIDVTFTTGAIAQELILASKAASLMVLGVTTKHATAALAFDTVPHEVVRHSRCPVLLVPAECEEWHDAPVVCGIDRSANSVAALHWAAGEAARHGVVLHVVEINPRQRADQSNPSDADSLQRWVSENLPQSAATVVCTTCVARASHRLLDIAHDLHGLLVVGAHQRSGWRPASVARVVSSQTRVPVVIVPADNSTGSDEVELSLPQRTEPRPQVVSVSGGDSHG